jgi:hypothetical protein
MERPKPSAAWWPLLVAGLAGAAYIPGSTGQGKTAQPAAAALSQVADTQSTDALAVLAQHFGLNTTEGALKRRALQAIGRLESARIDDRIPCPLPQQWPAEPLPTWRQRACDDIEFLDTLFGLRIDPEAPGLQHARAAWERLNYPQARSGDVRRAADVACVGRFLRWYLNDEALRASNADPQARRWAADFARLDRQQLTQAMVDQAARATRTQLSFLVATVPDGFDSYIGWTLDPALDAIRRAAEAQRYVMDRFFLPDWSAQRPAGAIVGQLHEEQPGVMLFRDQIGGANCNGAVTAISAPGARDTVNPSACVRSLLAVLLTFETPTGGIPGPALDKALRLASWWRGPGSFRQDGDAARRELRILGPYYSGSATSLVHGLRRWTDRERWDDVLVVTGSATNPAIKAVLSAELKAPGTLATVKVRMKATTVADDRCAMVDALYAAGVERVAWLTESNTDFGRFNAAGTQGGGAGTALLADCGMNDKKFFAASHTFPLYVSRLRTGVGAGPPAISALRRLELAESFTPADALPSLSPSLTAAVAELMLRNIARMLARDHIQVVVIVATDPRDTLFLAREIRLMHGPVSFATTNANLLYAHPDYADAARGMLVLSGARISNQAGMRQERESFVSSSARGIYEAGLLVLEGAPAAKAALPPRGATESTRQLWLSMVGREDVWPLHAQPIRIKNSWGDASTAPATVGDESLDPASPAGIEATAFYLAMSAIVALHVFAFVTGRPMWMRRFWIRQWAAPARERTMLARRRGA